MGSFRGRLRLGFGLGPVPNLIRYLIIYFAVGIAYNIHQRSLSKQVQNTGLHNGAPGFKFIKFPSTFKSLSFSNDECLNHEGVAILLTIEFQHRARPKQLREIIMGFRDQDNYVKMLKYVFEACSLLFHL